MSHGLTGLRSPKALSLLKGCILIICMEWFRLPETVRDQIIGTQSKAGA